MKTSYAFKFLPGACLMALFALGFQSKLQSQITTPPSGIHDFIADTIYDPVAQQSLQSATVYNIADGVTVTLRNGVSTINGGVFRIPANMHFTIAPSGSDGTGRIIFKDNEGGAEGGVFYIENANVNITNADFIANSATTSGGVIRNTTNAPLITLTNVLFRGNTAPTGGVIRNFSNLLVTSGVFDGNHTNVATGYGGAVQNGTANKQTIFANTSFTDNRAGRSGGGIAHRAAGGASLTITDAPEISGNWAGQYGGFLLDDNNTPGNEFNHVTITITGSHGTDYTYSGNVAGAASLNAAAAPHIVSGSYALAITPQARAGGFYYATGAGRLTFNIQNNATLSIGSVDRLAFDTFATADVGTGAIFEKNGNGSLILYADNSYYKGTVKVNEGTLLLGSAWAGLGGAIEIAAGATFGGSGTLNTYTQASAVLAGRTSVTASTGATIFVGSGTNVIYPSFTINGNVILKDDSILSYDLYSSDMVTKLVADSITQEAGAIINFNRVDSGTFTLAEWAAGGLDDGRLAITVRGGAQTARTTGNLFVEGSELKASMQVFDLDIKWTGAEGAAWDRDGNIANWSDGQANAEKYYRMGDQVTFDSVADSANPENRTIILEDDVTVTGMTVSGTGDYTFGGTGRIFVGTVIINGGTISGTTALKKEGTGSLIFSNTGSNNFTRGIEISGGLVGFDNALQLNSGIGGISFADTGTLRAEANVSGSLTNAISIAAGVAATLEVASQGTLVHGGVIASGDSASALRKTGGGSLNLLGNNRAYAGSVLVAEGSLILAGANAGLGGKISVGAGATFGGSGTAGAGAAGNVIVASGATLKAGHSDAVSGTLTLNNLTVTGGAIFQIDLFDDMDGAVKQSDRIMGTGSIQISGTNIIDIATLASGTFNLGDLTGLAGAYQVTLNDMVLPTAGRLSAALDTGAGYLRLITSSDKSRNIQWTGAGGNTWNTVAAGWAASDDVNQYSYGDRASFDGIADAANAGNRIISIEGTQVSLSDMAVSGGADYTFAGGGGIVVRKSFVMDDGTAAEITGAQGKLVKSGSGTLAFANNSRNFFEGGIDIDGGVVAFSRTDHLDTTGTAITFTGDGTLRADAGDIELANTLFIETANTAAIDSNGHSLAFTGTLLGGAGAMFAKTGGGTLAFGADADVSAFSGTMSIRAGTLMAGAADQLTNSAAALIAVETGATLDLAGHDQTLSNLAGAGVVELGDATLTYDVAGGGTQTFAGAINGEGRVVKQGGGKWILSGSSAHTGGFIYSEGQVGIAHDNALGAGAVTVSAADARLVAETDNLRIANDIAINSGSLTLVSGAARAVEYAGAISGVGGLVTEGGGTVVLSGNNSYASLSVGANGDNVRVVAKRAESVSGPVRIADGSVLEFNNVAAGQAHSAITGDHVVFTSSTLGMLGTNNLWRVTVGTQSQITALTPDSLGGKGADILVNGGASLTIAGSSPVVGHNMLVDNGTIIFGAEKYVNSLKLAGTLDFANGGEIRLGAIMPTGIYTVIVAERGILTMPGYDPHQGGMFMVLDILGSGTLQITAYNKALEPGKDIVVGIDSMINSMRAVNAHISEELFTPLIGRNAGDKPERSLWFRAIGSFAEYGQDSTHVGYTDTTWAGIIGYDVMMTGNFIGGIYAGHSRTKLDTTNNASSDIRLPCIGLYGSKRFGDFYLIADLMCGLGTTDTERNEDFGNHVTGSYDFDGLGAGIEIGHLFRIFARGTLRPFAAMHYMDLSFYDYAESGQGAVRLDDFHTHSLQGVLGVKFSHEMKFSWGAAGVLDVNVGWRENLHAETSDVRATLIAYPNASFQIRGDEYDSHGVTGGIGVRAALSKRTALGIAYDFDYIPAGDYDTDTIRHTFNAVIRFSW
jgi:autotransporter-associated beta strand protein